MFKNKRILVLAAHTDDGEIGCGGTILKAIEQGAEVYHVAFSIARKSVPEGFREDILSEEFSKANEVLGIVKHWHYDYPVRHFPSIRQEILEEMIRLRDLVKPDIVFCPSVNDFHQDHHVVYQEAIRAFKYCTLIGYEFVWNTFYMGTNFFVELSTEEVQKKTDAIDEYKSQKPKRYMKSSGEIFKLAEFNGNFIGVKYAESFQIIRMIEKN